MLHPSNSLLRSILLIFLHKPRFFFLRNGFEVCDILEDVFVAPNRNMNGDIYGFVRFANVCDVDKLLKTLNNVCFGQYRVIAKLARFDKKVPREVVTERVDEGDVGKAGGKVLLMNGGGGLKVREKKM